MSVKENVIYNCLSLEYGSVDHSWSYEAPKLLPENGRTSSDI